MLKVSHWLEVESSQAGADAPSHPEPVPISRRFIAVLSEKELQSLLCEVEGISSDLARSRLDYFARSTGVVNIGKRWFCIDRHFSLPPMSREAYERILMALDTHSSQCHRERVRHGQTGNYDAARASASEIASTAHTIRVITALTRKP